MIKVSIYQRGEYVFRFKIYSHGDPVVCAGVSALAITCVNFIKSQLKVKCLLKYEHNGGMIEFAVIDPRHEPTALILNHFVYGIEQIRKEYPKQIRVRTLTES